MLKEAKLVSIIVRTLGQRPNLLRSALESLVTQTHQSLEIIVVEDGSAHARDLIDDFRRTTDKKIDYHTMAKSGRSLAGNHGLENANGSLIGFLDEDDLLLPTHVETLVAALANDASFKLAYARSDVVLSQGLYEDQVVDLATKPHEACIPFSRTKLWLKNQFPIQSALFYRSLYEQFGGFDPTFELLEDWDLWIRYSAVEEFLAVDTVTSMYRLPENPESLKIREALHLEYKVKLVEKHRDLIAAHKFEDISDIPGATLEALPVRRALSIAASALIAKAKNIGRSHD